MLPPRPYAAVVALCDAVADRLLALACPAAVVGVGDRFAAFRGRAPVGLRRFVVRVASEGPTDTDPTDTVVVALVLLERVAAGVGAGAGSGGGPPPDALCLLFVVAHLVAAKLLTDFSCYLPMHPCAARAGVSTADLARLELAFLADLLAFDVSVHPSDFAATAGRVGWSAGEPERSRPGRGPPAPTD